MALTSTPEVLTPEDMVPVQAGCIVAGTFRLHFGGGPTTL